MLVAVDATECWLSACRLQLKWRAFTRGMRRPCTLQTLYGWVGSPDGPGLFETRQAIIDKAGSEDIAKLSDKYVRHEDLPGVLCLKVWLFWRTLDLEFTMQLCHPVASYRPAYSARSVKFVRQVLRYVEFLGLLTVLPFIEVRPMQGIAHTVVLLGFVASGGEW